MFHQIRPVRVIMSGYRDRHYSEFAYRRIVRRTNITINEHFVGNIVPQATGISTPERYNSRFCGLERKPNLIKVNVLYTLELDLRILNKA